MSLRIEQPGMLSLLQDAGRFGQHGIGLTTGGPLDAVAFRWANRLLGNAEGATAIEVSFGGLVLIATADTRVCLTGAVMPLTIDAEPRDAWTTHTVREGQRIELGFAERGCRAYLAASGGFDIPASFGSSATVLREGIGGLAGDKLQPGDELPCAVDISSDHFTLPADLRPIYGAEATLRVVPGYQQSHFPRVEQRRFYHAPYTVSDRCDRMGYRLEGPAVSCDIEGILSEGICHGAIQVPADGQPIVLMNDRQTIGGYPKIGAAYGGDTGVLAQLRPGDRVQFTPISVEQAHAQRLLDERRYQTTQPERRR